MAIVRLVTLFFVVLGLSACATPTIVYTPASAPVVVQSDRTLEEIYYNRLPRLPQPLEVVEVWYKDWSTLPDRGIVTPYDNLRCHEVRELKALLCAEWQALQAYRSSNFPFIFQKKKPWRMVFVYEYTNLSNQGGMRHIYALRYQPPVQYYHRHRGLQDRPLYRRDSPKGKAHIS